MFLGKVGVAENIGQDVVEVVRDPTGQLTNRLHFLGLAQLRFEIMFVVLRAFAFRVIPQQTPPARAFPVVLDPHGVAHPNILVAGGANSILQILSNPRIDRGLPPLDRLLFVIRMHHLQPESFL